MVRTWRLTHVEQYAEIVTCGLRHQTRLPASARLDDQDLSMVKFPLWFLLQVFLEKGQAGAPELLPKLSTAGIRSGLRRRVSAMPTRNNGSVEAEALQGEEGAAEAKFTLAAHSTFRSGDRGPSL